MTIGIIIGVIAFVIAFFFIKDIKNSPNSNTEEYVDSDMDFYIDGTYSHKSDRP